VTPVSETGPPPTAEHWPLTAATAPNAEPAIVVDHLVRRFGGRVVLQDLSFTVAAGVAFGIAAANGAGKTVLLSTVPKVPV